MPRYLPKRYRESTLDSLTRALYKPQNAKPAALKKLWTLRRGKEDYGTGCGGMIGPKSASIIAAMSDRLSLLWKSRERLTQAEWEELYGLIASVLSRARMLQGNLPGRQELIHDFFVDKLLFGRSDASPYSEAALLFYFKRYQYDRMGREPVDFSEEPEAESCTSSNWATDVELPLFLREREPKISYFFDHLSVEEKLLVALVQCEDHSVLEVEQQHSIRSGAYRAKQLGIVLSRNAIPESWRSTKLGRTVIDDLGILVEEDSRADLLQVFRLLCAKATEWWKAQR